MSSDAAIDCIAGYGLGLDMTMRGWQREATKAGGPWAIPGGFDTSVLQSTLVRRDNVRQPQRLDLVPRVNRETGQRSTTAQRHLTVDVIIQYVSRHLMFEVSNVAFVCVRAGVGPVDSDDLIDVGMPRIGALHHPAVVESEERR